MFWIFGINLHTEQSIEETNKQKNGSPLFFFLCRNGFWEGCDNSLSGGHFERVGFPGSTYTWSSIRCHTCFSFCVMNPKLITAARSGRGGSRDLWAVSARRCRKLWSSANVAAFPPAYLLATQKTKSMRNRDRSPQAVSAIKLQTLPPWFA